MAGKKAGGIPDKVDGIVIELMAGVTANMGGAERMEVIANNDVAGFFETPKGSLVQGAMPYDGSTNIAKIQKWTDVTLVIQPDAGPSMQINHAFQSNVIELKDAGGGFAIEFKGPRAVAT